MKKNASSYLIYMAYNDLYHSLNCQRSLVWNMLNCIKIKRLDSTRKLQWVKKQCTFVLEKVVHTWYMYFKEIKY